jgi:glycosyltransferase involved in cell wall biosynthesis
VRGPVVEHPPTISVVITSYNAANFIPGAVETVRNQTFRAHEIIVVDDQSTDHSVQVAESLGVRVVSVEHGGAAKARNAGIAESSGDWVATLDVDDIWHPRKLELQAAAILADPAIGLVFTDFDEIVFESGRLHSESIIAADGRISPLVDRRLTPHAILLDFVGINETLSERNVVLPTTSAFRRDVALSVGGFTPDVRAEDTEFFIRLAGVTRSAFVEVPLAVYMQHAKQITASLNPDMVQIELYKYVMANQSKYHERVIAIYRREFPRWLYYVAVQKWRAGNKKAAVSLLLQATVAATRGGSLGRFVKAILAGGLVKKILARLFLGKRRQNERAVASLPTSVAVAGILLPWRAAAKSA